MKDYTMNVVTVTAGDNNTFSADKTYDALLKGYRKGKNPIALYSNMVIPLVAFDNKFYFALSVPELNQYILITINSSTVTCTVTEPEGEE